MEPALGSTTHADPGGCTRQDNRSNWQRRIPAQELDQGRDIENHVLRVGILESFPIDPGADAECIRIEDLIGGDKPRAHRSKGVEGFATAPLGSSPVPLPVTRTDIIRHGVSKDMIEGALTGDIAAGLADHNGELSLVVDLCGKEFPWDCDRGTGIQQSGGILKKEDGEFRDLGIHLLGVPAVVESDAEDRRRDHRSE